jgi:guanylate kinase
MTTPPLDEDARARGRDHAMLARRRRAQIKVDLKQGRIQLADVLASRNDSVLARLRVGEVLRSLPGVGFARAHRVLSECDIDPSRRLGQLGQHQVSRLIDRMQGSTTQESTARLIVLSGPSGVGKSSVVGYLREHHPRIWFSISVTTRAPRPGEIDGVDYHFVDQVEFDRLRVSGELLEWAVFAGNSYGTPAEPVRRRLARGEPVICEIELQGARQVRVQDPSAVLVFLAPPSWDELVTRLTGRGTEAPEVVAERLATARRELAAESEFDVVVVNDSVAEAAEEILGLITG